MFSQRSQPWAPLRLGSSKWTVGDSGCLTVCVAQALVLSGYAVDPSQVVESFDFHGCYTDSSYPSGAGLLYTDRIHSAYPQFSKGSGPFDFVRVDWSGNQHWLLLYQATYYDPWDGTEHDSLPSRYSYRSDFQASIVQNMQVIPAEAKVVPVTTDFWVRLTARVNFREQPATSSPVYATYPVGTEVECDGQVTGDSVNGNTTWFRSKLHGKYVTSAYATPINNPSSI